MLNIGRLVNSLNHKHRIKKSVIKIPSEIRYIKRVSSKILESLKSYNLDDSLTFDIRLCVEEAVRNAIVHGNRCDRAKAVRIVYWVKKDTLKIEIEDAGEGFDYKKLPDPTSDENLMKGSGRGVYLIKHLMDEVEFDGAGSRVSMTKRLRP